MNSKKILSLILLGFLALPSVIFAQLTGIGSGPDISLTAIMHGAEYAAGFIFGSIAVICFVVAGILFLTAQGAPEKLKTAKAAVLWGVVGVVVGIVAFSVIALVEAMIT